jgi:DNA-binding NarL/FixJ family response regulator
MGCCASSHAIRAVGHGDVYVSPALAYGVLRKMSKPKPPEPLSELTERDRGVLELLASGLSNREIS